MSDSLHERLWAVCQRLPTDFEPYGEREREDADCSCGCKYFAPLEGEAGNDWGVCHNAKSPRAGLLTFEHQGCPEFEHDPDIDEKIEALLKESKIIQLNRGQASE